MAMCESQLDSALPQAVERARSTERSELSDAPGSSEAGPARDALFALNQGGLPLTVDYRSPVSHFIPPAVEIYANKHKPEPISTESSQSPTPAKRKRGRPRVDKTSPEYLAKSAARKRAKEMSAALNSSEGGEKRKRGRPRIDKTSPDYLARKRAREQEALERRANRQYKRKTAGDSAASSSGEATPRVKRKYTKRNPNGTIGRPRKDPEAAGSERVKGKRGRPRKQDVAAGRAPPPKIRVRSNLMPMNDEPITLDSDDEPDLGSPSQASDSQISFDENLRAIQHLHEKYANLDRDDAFNAELLAGKASEGRSSARELDTRVEKLEDSSNSDSDSSSSSGSGSSSSSSSSSSGSSSSSSESDSSDAEGHTPAGTAQDDRSFGAWSHQSGDRSGERSGSESSVERARSVSPTASISESDNESPDKTIQCRVCLKWYSTIVTLKIHRRVHLNRGGGGGGRSRARSASRYPCEQCERSFSRREKLHEHRESAHRGSMTVRCSLCRACFEHDADLARHEQEHTADEREGRCGECGAVFPRHELLRRHRAAAHTHTHACPTCGKSFHHAHSLTRHLHNHARQLYKCVVCKASFARADQLAQHLNSHLANYKRLKP